jgi:hypothetical protein
MNVKQNARISFRQKFSVFNGITTKSPSFLYVGLSFEKIGIFDLSFTYNVACKRSTRTKRGLPASDLPYMCQYCQR